jgi:hypothetical protein
MSFRFLPGLVTGAEDSRRRCFVWLIFLSGLSQLQRDFLALPDVELLALFIVGSFLD